MMATNEYNSRNSLVRSRAEQGQKYSSNPIVHVVTSVVRVEESIKTAWNSECNKSAILRSEFEAWDEYDRKHN